MQTFRPASFCVLLALSLLAGPAASAVKVVKQDYQIDSVDPGIKLFVRSKMAEGTKAFTNDNIVLFVHGATFPSTPDFDLQHKVQKVTLIGWSWGAMTAGYYTSLHSDKIQKLVLYAPAYAFALHPNLGPGSNSQNKRRPYEFNFGLGAYRLATGAANQARWDGEIPVQDKNQYREQGVVDAFNAEALATDPTSNTRNPPSLRAPNGVLEDTFMQATGRRIWNASSIYVPVLVIAGEFDTWSFPEDREGLMRDLTNAPSKRSVLINEATHFVLFEKKRFEFFEAIEAFLKEMHSKPP